MSGASEGFPGADAAWESLLFPYSVRAETDDSLVFILFWRVGSGCSLLWCSLLSIMTTSSFPFVSTWLLDVLLLVVVVQMLLVEVLMVVVLSSLVASSWVAIVLMGVSFRAMVGVLVLVLGGWMGLSSVGAGLGMAPSATARVVER